MLLAHASQITSSYYIWSVIDFLHQVLNKSIFPIAYNSQVSADAVPRPLASHSLSAPIQFYSDVLKSGALSRLAFYNIDMCAMHGPVAPHSPHLTRGVG